MEAVEKVRSLQVIYAGALADSVLRLGKEGVLDKVTQQKREEQLAGGRVRAGQLGMSSPEEVFIKLSDLMGCADWLLAPNENGGGFTATASRCMLCAMAKKLGAQSPCHIFCLDPMEGMIKGLDENAGFNVQCTLYEGACCRVVIEQRQETLDKEFTMIWHAANVDEAIVLLDNMIFENEMRAPIETAEEIV